MARLTEIHRQQTGRAAEQEKGGREKEFFSHFLKKDSNKSSNSHSNLTNKN
jgi:hypothetical protein